MQNILETALQAIRPALQADGGDIEFVEITTNNIVRVRFLGQCKGCPKAGDTLRRVVERTLLKMVPEIRGVEIVK